MDVFTVFLIFWLGFCAGIVFFALYLRWSNEEIQCVADAEWASWHREARRCGKRGLRKPTTTSNNDNTGAYTMALPCAVYDQE